MARKVTFAPGEWYHLYNRGTDKREIYSSGADYERFIRLLYLCNGTVPTDVKLQGETLYDALRFERGDTLIDIASYCLMPNHFHLLVREKRPGGISRFMQKLTTGYTMYFNKRHERSGALFQGVFKSQHARDDRYLKYLVSYIHLNPLKLIAPRWKERGFVESSGAMNYLQNYKHSSYLDYAGTSRLEAKILNTSALPIYFDSPQHFVAEIKSWFADASLQGETL